MKPYIKISLLYLILGAAWIFFSDRFFSSISPAEIYINYIQTYKGWFFILATSTMLFFLTRRMYYKIQEREEEKRIVFYTTMRAVHHILNNFLQKMIYFKTDESRNNLLSEKAQIQYDEMIRVTSKQLIKLGEISNINTEEIEKAAYPEKFGKTTTNDEDS